jgi:hypothetical protein
MVVFDAVRGCLHGCKYKKTAFNRAVFNFMDFPF